MAIFNRSGFTLIEVVVATFLISIVFLGIFAAYQLGLQVVGYSKNRVIATSIANAELEKIRNLSYESIGVAGSFPEGPLEGESEVIQNNITFKIERRVDFVIDEADGIAQPEDDCPQDYKRADVKVLSLGKFSVEVLMATDIPPKNLAQECAQGGGILSVMVFDALGTAVSSPSIEIKDPATDTVLKTAFPIDGRHFFSLEPATYKVVVSKSGYSQERTYGTNEVAQPERPHPIVLESELTETSFSIDRLSSFSVETLSRVGEETFPLGNVTFNLRGAKLIGYDQDDNPIYKYSENHTSNAQGSITIPNLEWDNYTFSEVSPPDLNLTETNPAPQPIGLAPNTTLPAELFFSAGNTLLVTVLDSNTLGPIFSAQVRLHNGSLNYDVTQYTDEQGKTYFIPLQEATYNLDIEASGYSNESTQVFVSGQTVRTINLEPVE